MKHFDDYPTAIACSDPDTGEQLYDGRPIGDDADYTHQDFIEIFSEWNQAKITHTKYQGEYLVIWKDGGDRMEVFEITDNGFNQVDEWYPEDNQSVGLHLIEKGWELK